ncbi:hypothetical protein Btru_067597 [Bulinus truncatus]|nr:hypothetical protein Btru_067597 [Bulinus truncatus]
MGKIPSVLCDVIHWFHLSPPLVMTSTYTNWSVLVGSQCIKSSSPVNSSQSLSASNSCPQHLAKVVKSKSFVHNHVCYLFVNNELYWKDAREKCWNLGGEMLAIENEETMNFIKQTLESPELGWQRNGVWLGANLQSKVWRWTNGRKMNYSNWAKGEPSEILGILSVEDCILMWRSFDWKWKDNLCGTMRINYNYICQFPLSKPGDSNVKVASEALQYEKDNGYATILTWIIGLCSGLLLLMLFVFLLLHYRFAKSKHKAALGAVHFRNNSFNNNNTTATENSPHPELPRSMPPAVLPFHETPMYTEVVKPNNHLAQASQSDSVQLIGTSLPSLSDQGACGGSDPELDLKTPLITQNAVSSSVPDQDHYIDMCSVSSRNSDSGLLKDDLHTYSNVELKVENLYESLP